MQLHLYKVTCKYDNDLYPRKTAIILASEDDMAHDAALARSGVREIISVRKIDGPFQNQQIIYFGQNMKLQLIGLKQFDRKISSIKALRAVTGYGLRKTKDIVEDMIHSHRSGASICCEVTVLDPPVTAAIRKRDVLELAKYFDFTGEPSKAPIDLKLWEVTCAISTPLVVSGTTNKLRTAIAYILASSRDKAINTITNLNQTDSVMDCKEIKPPFEDGHLLFMWNLK